MRNCVSAILLSILFHALVAVGLVAYLEYAPQPDVLATLDLSSVELSFSEQIEESAAVAPMPPAAERRLPSPPPEETPPEAKLKKPLPPDPSAPKFPEPKEDRPNVKPQASNPQLAQPAPPQARLDAPPRQKRNIRPDYPKGARQRGEQGDVVLEIRVNAEGSVDDVKVEVSSGFSELDEAAVKAARTARFSPARRGREAVASTARLKLQFKLK